MTEPIRVKTLDKVELCIFTGFMCGEVIELSAGECPEHGVGFGCVQTYYREGAITAKLNIPGWQLVALAENKTQVIVLIAENNATFEIRKL